MMHRTEEGRVADRRSHLEGAVELGLLGARPAEEDHGGYLRAASVDAKVPVDGLQRVDEGQKVHRARPVRSITRQQSARKAPEWRGLASAPGCWMG